MDLLLFHFYQLQPRVYPAPFARKLVKMIPEMKRSPPTMQVDAPSHYLVFPPLMLSLIPLKPPE